MADDAQSLLPNALQPAAQPTADLRLRLIRKLLSSQDPAEQIRHFYNSVADRLSLSGVEYRPPGTTLPDVNLGKNGRHHCDYRLHCEDHFLGEVLFSRDRRFAETERVWLETWLGELVQPLSNALRYQEALSLALQDSLTGVGNRAALDSAMHRELRLAERYGSDFSLLLVDVDHFKQVNDCFGHSLGDKALQQLANAIQNLCRDSDLLFRYGGEEFVVLLSKTDHAGARVIAERIRQGVEEQVAVSDGEQSQAITVSIGIGTRRPEGEPSIHSLFDQADRALYRAKREGRNRVIAGFSPDREAGASVARPAQN